MSLLLAALANALLLVMLFTLAPVPTKPREDAQRPPATFTLLPEGRKSASDEKPVEARSRANAAPPPRPRVTPQLTPPRVEAVTPDTPPLNMIVMDRGTFAASDIARLPSATTAGQVGMEAGSGGIGDSQLAGGQGPGGEPLYGVEWYRKPSHADLAGFRYNRGPGTGWGEIACRTAPNYRVVDCVELAQSPPNSGLAGVVRDAAPNFRVRPPRIGGKALVGSWVRIHIDYSEKAD